MSINNWFCGDCSDADGYLDICRKAVEDDEIFHNFKSIKAYQPILEHTSIVQGKIYAAEIKSIFEELGMNANEKDEFIEKCRFNDALCQPSMIHTEECGIMSPSTLRYAFFAAKILKFIKGDKINSVLDIGGGYGGMSLLINKVFGAKDIYLNDLDDVLNLQNKYLGKHNLQPLILSDNIGDFYNRRFDLCVSTFAYSELIRTQRVNIVDNIFGNCKYVFLVCNFINNQIFEDSELHDLLDKSERFEFYKESHEGHICSVFMIENKPSEVV